MFRNNLKCSDCFKRGAECEHFLCKCTGEEVYWWQRQVQAEDCKPQPEFCSTELAQVLGSIHVFYQPVLFANSNYFFFSP
jgi:hypothetical protein